MAYKSCAAKIAANIQQDCNRPLVGGYTGRAVIMSATDFERAEVVRSASNPRKILSIVLPPDGSVMAYTIDNVFSAPFTGSTTTGNNENGRNGYLKTLSVRVPMRGADTSMKVIEPLVKSADGFVIIAEKSDKVGDGSYEVIGYQNALRGDISGVTRDESANGGDWVVPLNTVETWAEVDLVGAAETYESAKKEFEMLLNFEVFKTYFTLEEVGAIDLSADGLVIVEYFAGKLVRQMYSGLNDTTIEIPSGHFVTVYGRVTSINKNGTGNLFRDLDTSNNAELRYLNCGSSQLIALNVSANVNLEHLDCNGCTNLTSLDLSKNTALTYFNCNGCTNLTSLDLSKNTALTYFNCGDCGRLMLLDVKNTKALEGGTILDQSMANLTTLQVAGTSAWAYEQVESWLSDFAPDNGIIYVDENTPQGVITEAETKNWEVIYVS